MRVPIESVRVVQPVNGRPRLRVDFDPRPGYALARPELRETTNGIEVLGGGVPLHLATSVPVPYVLGRREFSLTRPVYFVLSYGAHEEVPNTASVMHDL